MNWSRKAEADRKDRGRWHPCYVDTSLIIARYKPADALHKNSKVLFEKSDLKLYISPITLIELYSILSRIIRELELPSVKGLLLDTLVAFIVGIVN